MASERTDSLATALIMHQLGDGEWHSHRKILGDLIRTPASEYDIRSALRELRSDPQIESENRRMSYRHGAAWWYRLRS